MEAFATVKDLEARFRTLKEGEEERATALLLDASVMLATEFERVGESIDAKSELQRENLKRICCAMVKRVMSSGHDEDLSQTSMTAGSYTQQFTFANPTGDMYLTKNERKTLGLPMRKQRISCILPKAYGGRQ